MSRQLPIGTVSFLFTDVEGSTKLAQRLGIGFVPLMADQFALLHEAIREHLGVEVKSTGDGVFAAFASASDAVSAAIEMQKSIASHRWPAGGNVRVRIGVHTGEAAIVDDDYVGLDVHRAARVMAAAHGGQAVVTAATRLLAGSRFEFRDLGRHVLRGLESDEAIHQIVIAGLPSEFPPIRTATSIPNNLPTRLTPILGRVGEVETLSRLIEEHRLVTILGPGGVGKTSLALTVAAGVVDRFGGGVILVDLSSVSDPDLVVAMIATELKAEPRTPEGVVGHLGDTPCLLVLDNFEQVASAASQIRHLLESAPGTRVLATSQRPLRIPGEHRYLLEPLDPEGAEGVRLFLDRARAIAPGFMAGEGEVRELVRQLEGLPLAIELVAARANVLGPTQMLDRLRGDRMSYRTETDLPERHRTLEDALRWSYDLLSESTQRAFRRLGIFAGTMSVEGAEVLVGSGSSDALDELAELVDCSLLRRVVDSSGRFSMLDGIRRYARKQLEASDEAGEIEEHYVTFFLETCRVASTGLQGDRGEWWRAELNDDLENLRDVLAILLRTGRRGEGLEMLGNIWRFHQSRGHLVELDIWLERFFMLPEDRSDEIGTIKGLMARSAVLYWQKKPLDAIAGYRDAIGRARDHTDGRLLAEALHGLATSLIVAQRTDEAIAPLAEAKSIFAGLGDESGIADVIAAEAFATLNANGWSEAGARFKEAERIYDKVGLRTQAAQSVFAQAGAALAGGNLEEARRLTIDAIRRSQDLNDVFLQVWGIEYVSRIELDGGNLELAGLLAGVAEAAAERIGGGWSPATIGLEDSKPKMIREVGEDQTEQLMGPGRELSVEEAVAKIIGEHTLPKKRSTE